MSRKIELGINSAKIGRNQSEKNSGEFNLPKCLLQWYRPRTIICGLIMHFIADTDTDENCFRIHFS